MNGLEPVLLSQLTHVLLDCDVLQSNKALRRFFVDSRISIWHEGIPEADNVKERVGALIAYLLPKVDAKGQPGLVLFTQVLADQLSSQDGLRQQLQALILDLRDHWHPRAQLPANYPPYKGLAQYDVADAPLFYGREWLTTRLVQRLFDEATSDAELYGHFLAMVGASGSGKSSLARAGLLATLQSEAPLADGSLPPQGCSCWLYYVVRPGIAPIESLINALTVGRPFVDAQALRHPETGLAANRCCLAQYAAHLLAQVSTPITGTPHFILLVDQFEELFTLCPDPQQRRAFVDSLLEAARPPAPVRVVITMRADFYHHCADFPELFTLLASQQENVASMNQAELRHAISKPARQAGWGLEEGLLDTILHDVAAAGSGAGTLPLLSHALERSWAAAQDNRENQLTLRHYHQVGGVSGAVGQTAEQTFTALSPMEQAIAQNLLLRLTQSGKGTQDTRRRVRLAELQFPHFSPIQVDMVRKKLADARLVVVDGEEIELIHDALIREWGRLREWLETDRAGEQLHRRLTDAATEWHGHGREASRLYRGTVLSQAEAWAAAHAERLNNEEGAFLESSLAARERQRRQKTLFSIGIPAAVIVVLLIILGVVLNSNQRIRVEADSRATAEAIAVAEANTRATAQAGAEQEANSRATAEAVAFIRQGEEANARATAETSQRLAEDRTIEAERERKEAERQARIAQSGALAAASQAVSHESNMEAWLLAIEAGRTYTTSLAYTALYEQAPLLRRPLINITHFDWVGATWNTDESQILSWSGDGIVKVWDVRLGAPLFGLFHDSGVNGARWSESESRVLSWSDDTTARVWNANNGGLLLTLPHEDRVTGAIWNKDESRILSWSDDGVVKLWNSDTGGLQFKLSHEDDVKGSAWNNDETQVLSWSLDGTVKVWDAYTGMLKFTLFHEDEVHGATWNVDESQILSWSSNTVLWNRGTVSVWNAKTGTLQYSLFHNGLVGGATWNNDESQILSWSWDETVKVWDAATGELKFTLLHASAVSGAIWNKDESQILSWGGNGIVQVWDLGTKQLRITLSHDDWVFGAIWNEEQNRILTWSKDGTAKVWDASTGVLQSVLSHEWIVLGAKWNSDGTQILSWSEDTIARVWNTGTGGDQFIGLHGSQVAGVAWSRSGNQVLSWGYDSTAKVWDIATGVLQNTLSHIGNIKNVVYGAMWNKDESRILSWSGNGLVKMWDAVTGRLLFTLIHNDAVIGAMWNQTESQILTWSADGTIKVWDGSSGSLLLIMSSNDVIRGVHWNKTESQILSWNDAGAVEIWDASTGLQMLTLLHESYVLGAIWNREENRILSWSQDRTVKMWDANSGALLLTFNHEDLVRGANWNRAETQILAWSLDGMARVWDTDTGNLLFALHHDSWVREAIWNEAESQILSWGGDGTAKVWNASTGTLLFTLAHEDVVQGASWALDESRIMSWSGDGTTRVWDAHNGILLFELTGDGTPIYVAQWNPDESRILIGTEGGMVRVYVVDFQELLDIACTYATRNLTWQEWQVYLSGLPYRQTCPNIPIHPSVPQG